LRALLLHEDDLPVVEAKRKHVSVVGEVHEPLARAFVRLACDIGKEVVAVDVDLVGRTPMVWPAFSFSTMSGSPAAARKVGSQSWCWMISFETTPAGIFPGQRTISGTRNAPSQFVFFSLRNGVMPPSGQVFMCGPLSVE
jgi:hypothetical protein